MRIVLFASGEFAVPLAKHLLTQGQLVGVFTKTDKKKGRGMKVKPTPVAEAIGEGVPIYKADKLGKKLYEEYVALKPDVAVVIDYGIYIPSYFYSPSSPFMVNIHPSLLPRWRGPAPIQWTIYEGDDKTGITFHMLSKEIDAGDILYQVSYLLTGREKATELEHMLSLKLIDVWHEFIEKYQDGVLEPTPQGEGYTYAPMFDKDTMHIDFSLSCQTIDRLVRALADVPGAYAVFRDKRVKILYGECIHRGEEEEMPKPGHIVFVDKNSFGISTGDGIYVPLQLKPEGKKMQRVEDFIRGYRPEVGEHWS